MARKKKAITDEVLEKTPPVKEKQPRKKQEASKKPNALYLDPSFVLALNTSILEEAKKLDLDLDFSLERNIKDCLSSGSLTVDLISGGGLLYPGRRTNLFGKEQGGKSLFSYYGIKDAIDNKVTVIFYDYEGTTELSRLENIGIKVDWSKEKRAKEPVYFWYINDLITGEQAFRHARRVMKKLPRRKTGYPSLLIVVDSIPAMNPQVSDEKDESKQTAQLAAMLSREFPKVKSLLASRRVCWLDTNQLRDRPGHAFGSPEYEVGGYASRHYGDIRMKLTRLSNPNNWGKGIIEEEKSIEGGLDKYNYIRVETQKNKMFVPFKKAFVRVWFERNGKPYGIIDPFYDVYEYLKLTGQLTLGRRRVLTVKLKGWEGEYGWLKFKKLVLTNKEAIYTTIREQFNNGDAFDFYFSQTSGIPKEEIDDEDEDDDEEETGSL